jgi:RNA polymerase sigma-70 factor (ECF subfamily)
MAANLTADLDSAELEIISGKIHQGRRTRFPHAENIFVLQEQWPEPKPSLTTLSILFEDPIAAINHNRQLFEILPTVLSQTAERLYGKILAGKYSSAAVPTRDTRVSSHNNSTNLSSPNMNDSIKPKSTAALPAAATSASGPALGLSPGITTKERNERFLAVATIATSSKKSWTDEMLRDLYSLKQDKWKDIDIGVYLTRKYNKHKKSISAGAVSGQWHWLRKRIDEGTFVITDAPKNPVGFEDLDRKPETQHGTTSHQSTNGRVNGHTIEGYAGAKTVFTNRGSEQSRGDRKKSHGLNGGIEAEIPHLRRYARALARDVVAADDLVQACLVRAIGKIHLWQEGTDLRAWLFTILRNQYIDNVRRTKREGTSVVISDTDPHLVHMPTQDKRLELRDLDRAIARLPEEQRSIILLVGLIGLSYDAVAEDLGLPLGTVRSRLSRGRDALRKLMSDKEDCDFANHAAYFGGADFPTRENCKSGAPQPIMGLTAATRELKNNQSARLGRKFKPHAPPNSL